MLYIYVDAFTFNIVKDTNLLIIWIVSMLPTHDFYTSWAVTNCCKCMLHSIKWALPLFDAAVCGDFPFSTSIKCDVEVLTLEKLYLAVIQKVLEDYVRSRVVSTLSKKFHRSSEEQRVVFSEMSWKSLLYFFFLAGNTTKGAATKARFCFGPSSWRRLSDLHGELVSSTFKSIRQGK